MNINELQGSRLKAFREHLGINQRNFAKLLDLQSAYLSQIESGIRSISHDLIEKLSLRYNSINLNWLLTGRGDMLIGLMPVQSASQSEGNISLMDISVAAGTMSDTDIAGRVVEKFSLPNLRGEDYYALYVDGDSMTPTYNNGDLVVVRKIDQIALKQDEVYLINLRGSLPVLKRVRRKSQLEFELHSDNASIGPYSVDAQSIASLFRVYAVIRHK